jgi:hypothetical protein
MHVVETYKRRGEAIFKVLVTKIVSPAQVLQAGTGSIHSVLTDEGLGNSIGIYFYRFANLERWGAFTKIGEVSRAEGVIVRKQRGWLAPNTYGDSYLKASTKGERKQVHSDVMLTTKDDPMYFVFYQFDVENSFPKIDEMVAFAKHGQHFGRSTRNREQANTFSSLGRSLVWHEPAFNEVLDLRLPSGRGYHEAFC